MIKLDRYPGPRPFEESEKHLFFGRSTETDELFDQICSSNIVTVHGESGLGKSSLISAGLVPKLRENYFFPFLIRFKDKNKSPLEQIIEIFEKTAHGFNWKPLEDCIDSNKIWHWIKFFNKNKVKPVLIFDQFEEFFYFEQPTRLVFIKELSTILSSRIPAEVNAFLTNGREDSSEGEENSGVGDENFGGEKDSTSDFHWFTPPDFKLLFSLRSDRLGFVDEVSRYIPSFLKNRYQVKPIVADRSEQAIVVPALLDPFDEVLFNSKSFEYEQQLINKIIEVVKDKAKNTVDTTQLQMICQEIEVIAKSKNVEKPIITLKDLKGEDGLKELVKNFYKKQLEKIKLNPGISNHEYFTLRKLIEKRLIVGKKRVLLAADVVKEYINSQNIPEAKTSYLLDVLLSLRLIRDQIYGDSQFYEISHDTFIEPILIEKSKRELKDKIEKEKANAKRLAEEEKRFAEEQKANLEKEQARQKLEIENQNKYISQIEAEKVRAEAAERSAKSASLEAQKNEALAKSALQKLNEIRKRNIRLARIAFALLLFILSYVLYLNIKTGKYNQRIKGQLAKISNYEAEDNYFKGNQILAYGLWENAVNLIPSDTVPKVKIKTYFFAPFAGTDVKVTDSKNYIGTRYIGDELFVWINNKDRQYDTILTKNHIQRFDFVPGTDKLWYISDAKNLFIHDLKTNRAINIFSDSLHINKLKISNVKFLDNNLFIISEDSTNRLLIFDLQKEELLRSLTNSVSNILNKKFTSKWSLLLYMNRINNLRNYDSSSISLADFPNIYLINKYSGKTTSKEWIPNKPIFGGFTFNKNLTKLVYVDGINLVIKNLFNDSIIIKNSGILAKDELNFIQNDSSILVSKYEEATNRYSNFKFDLITNTMLPIPLKTLDPFSINLTKFIGRHFLIELDSKENLHIIDFQKLKIIKTINNVKNFTLGENALFIMLKNNNIYQISSKDLKLQNIALNVPSEFNLHEVYGSEFIKLKKEEVDEENQEILLYQDAERNNVSYFRFSFDKYLNKSLDKLGVSIK